MSIPLSYLPLVDLLADLGEQGECRFVPDLHMGPDAFEDESLNERRARVDAAKDMCRECPVRERCLEYVLRLPKVPEHGVWAGMSARELAALRVERRRTAEIETGDAA